MDLFVSYAWGRDGHRRAFARVVVAFLRARGFSVWFDEDQMAPGAAVRGGTDGAMASAIGGASAVVILLSPDYAVSASCKKEADFAGNHGKPLFFVNAEAGFSPHAFDAADPAASAARGWLSMLVGRALWADGSGGEAAWGAPGGGGATLLAALGGDARVRRSGGAAPPSAPPAARIPWADLRFDERDEDGGPLVLGQGSFGTVIGATYSHMRVAVKQLPPGRRLPPAAVAELEREAALQARLSHDHVVRVYGFAVSTADPARPKYGLVMARLHEQLQAVLERAAAGDGPPPPLAWRLSAVHQVAVGLAHLHARRVVHADVKPANVMLTPPETGSLLQLTDCKCLPPPNAPVPKRAPKLFATRTRSN